MIGQYEPLPEPGTWHCYACDDLARAAGLSRSVAVIDNQVAHDRWHQAHRLQQATALAADHTAARARRRAEVRDHLATRELPRSGPPAAGGGAPAAH